MLELAGAVREGEAEPHVLLRLFGEMSEALGMAVGLVTRPVVSPAGSQPPPLQEDETGELEPSEAPSPGSQCRRGIFPTNRSPGGPNTCGPHRDRLGRRV